MVSLEDPSQVPELTDGWGQRRDIDADHIVGLDFAIDSSPFKYRYSTDATRMCHWYDQYTLDAMTVARITVHPDGLMEYSFQSSADLEPVNIICGLDNMRNAFQNSIGWNIIVGFNNGVSKVKFSDLDTYYINNEIEVHPPPPAPNAPFYVPDDIGDELIFNGVPALQDEFKSVVSVQLTVDHQFTGISHFLCTGVVVGTTARPFVLTAKHCIDSMSSDSSATNTLRIFGCGNQTVPHMIDVTYPDELGVEYVNSIPKTYLSYDSMTPVTIQVLTANGPSQAKEDLALVAVVGSQLPSCQGISRIASSTPSAGNNVTLVGYGSTEMYAGPSTDYGTLMKYNYVVNSESFVDGSMWCRGGITAGFEYTETSGDTGDGGILRRRLQSSCRMYYRGTDEFQMYVGTGGVRSGDSGGLFLTAMVMF